MLKIAKINALQQEKKKLKSFSDFECLILRCTINFLGDLIMAQKKQERKKELDRRRKRRAERLKDRIREAKAAKK